MLWVEQPLGTGFTQRTSDLMDEVQPAQELMGFYKNWIDGFKAHGKKVYITGESSGGYYVPYITDAFLNANDTTYYNLAGVAINDPTFGHKTLQQEGESLIHF